MLDLTLKYSGDQRYKTTVIVPKVQSSDVQLLNPWQSEFYMLSGSQCLAEMHSLGSLRVNTESLTPLENSTFYMLSGGGCPGSLYWLVVMTSDFKYYTKIKEFDFVHLCA